MTTYGLNRFVDRIDVAMARSISPAPERIVDKPITVSEVPVVDQVVIAPKPEPVRCPASKKSNDARNRLVMLSLTASLVATACVGIGARNKSMASARVFELAPPRPVASPEQVNRLMLRADGLLAQGHIAAARLVLERAAEIGSARASFALAETYDPVVLVERGAVGTRGDAIKAQELYRMAQ